MFTALSLGQVIALRLMMVCPFDGMGKLSLSIDGTKALADFCALGTTGKGSEEAAAHGTVALCTDSVEG